MPGIGNPNKVKNPFGGIRKADGAQKIKSRKKRGNVGDKLNELAGLEEERKFVKQGDHNKMDKDAFLKLLSNQLANQDPFKPVDQKKFAADMAQFAQLEQLTNMNSKMEKNTVDRSQQDKFMATSFIGKMVKSTGTSIPYDGVKRTVNLPFHLEKPASKILIRVFDSSNNMISQIERESMGTGTNSVSWDGMQLDGIRAVKDNYRFEVRAFDQDFQPFKGKTYSEGLVTGATFEDGETVLTVDGSKKVYLRDVNSFSLPEKEYRAANNPGLQKEVNAAYNKQNTL
jgi:flagellar basal-body rod modification protein FlgD